MRSKYYKQLLIILFSLIFIIPANAIQGNNITFNLDRYITHSFKSKANITISKPTKELTSETNKNTGDKTDKENKHNNSMAPLFFIIIALIIGAATRFFLQKSPLPYTVSLLIFGMLLGVITRLVYF